MTAIGASDSSDAAPSAEQDKRVLNLLLLVEYTEAAFYAAALEDAGLTGELEDYARTVVAHEREHVAFLEGALGDQKCAFALGRRGAHRESDPRQLARSTALRRSRPVRARMVPNPRKSR